MAGWKVITAPASEPVDVEAAKLALRIGDDAEESLIQEWIKAGREYVENRTHRALVSQEIRLTLDCWPSRVIALPRPPLLTVDLVEYVDTAGVTQTLTEGVDFEVDDTAEPALIRPLEGHSWPATKRAFNAVTIEYTAGYGNEGAVPSRAKQAILLYVGDAYAHRETMGVGTVAYKLAQTIDDVLAELLRPAADEEAP